MTAPRPALWDIFCHVVDNLGDIGVCWRLSADLAARGHRVRLWVDEPEPLRWMAPGALEGRWPGIEVIPWTRPLPDGLAASLPPADVWIEAFGCDPPDEMVLALAERIGRGEAAPVWINLEYLSAEPWVERCHGLPSPVMSGPLKGLTKTFVYPGFTPRTGGLLREQDLDQRQAAFDARAWRQRHGVPDGALAVSLFCYDPAPALAPLLAQAAKQAQPVHWLVTPGRAMRAMESSLAELPAEQRPPPEHIHPLPLVDQPGFDEMLWACDLNIVRGEDSLVRALWAGKPFIWHIYPQHDHAHHAKLEAFLDWLGAPAEWAALMRRWNGTGGPAQVQLPAMGLSARRPPWTTALSRPGHAPPCLGSTLLGQLSEKS
ncbi:MAG TPA: elongation factor P maturation arginine rhamnosyltransferase EarP [Hydrogenophaga sp.]|uniref:elongation factor P maturation arginine rhamnosyltransferase EarP n=1 Tax=Hydrogenophaga sp. TaxID=1904254 RepID=UPI002CF3BCBD|nr:elongation factor P maturation arginine rhamnosyltransferase EarP [Hydrogenophaga sp.]HMN91673.1 elongation factor P maturation arginine rhamnosyltransferase EarP [Hydrogenophaga sp.]HMP11255.1 elongation factor P maturation arginine rhamnosyltransferase EarP [Hydrogenophaga sp.]